MSMMQALIPSTILTLIVTAIIGHFGHPHALLNVQDLDIAGYVLHWSWTLFFVAMGLNGALILKMSTTSQGQAPDEPASA